MHGGPSASSDTGFLAGGGEVGGLIRAHDWAATPLGPPDGWPTALRTLLGVMLGSQQPMFLTWGAERTLLYNDGYAEILSRKHPAALGRPFLDVWAEIRNDLTPLLAEVDAGRSVNMEDITLVMERRGYPEETHFAFSYTPVRDKAGTVAGLFCPCQETTEQVFAKRRTHAERERLLHLFEQAPGFMAMLSGPDHRIELANPAFMRLVGPREMVGRTVAEALPDAVEQGYLDLLNQVYRSGEAYSSTAAKYVVQASPDAPPDERFVDFVYQPTTDVDGRVTGIFVEGSDATVRVAAEAAVRESEARFRNMADHAPVMMWITDPSGFCTYLNRRWYEFTGQREEEALGLGWTRATHPDDEQHAGDTFLASNAAQAPFRVEYRLRRADGVYRWAIDAASPRFGPGGEFLGYVGSVIDIGDRREAEERLRESEARFRTVAEAMPGFVWTADGSGNLDYTSPRWQAYSGVDPDDSLGQGWAASVHPDDQDLALTRWMQAVATRTQYEVEFRLKGRDDSYRWWLARALPSSHDASVEVRWIGVCTEIDDIVAARETLARSREHLEVRVEERTAERDRLWHMSRDLIAIVGGDGRYKRANPAWETELGYRPDELAGARFDVFIHPGDQAAAERLYLSMVEGTPVTKSEMRMRARDGSYRVVSWVVVAVEGDFYASGRDITDQRETEEALRQAQKMEAVGQLTGGIAHDFNNLLAGIVGSLDLMQTRIAQGRTEAIERYAKAAMSSAQRAAALTHRLLAFSRRQPLDPKPVNANQLVAGMEDLLRRTIGPSQALELVTAGGLWTTLCDPNQLESAILNLAINARDAMPDGGKLTIETANAHLDSAYAATLRDVTPGQYVAICISDTGTGMTPEIIARAFEPFFTTKPLGQGTGLGLSMVYGFAKQSEGHLKVYSEVGQGTTIKIYLPRHRGPAAADEEEAGPGAAPRGDPGESVLVVEDEPVIRDLIAEVLQDLGYRVLEASDGPAGLAILRSRERVDLLVTDVGLPGMNGRQLADQAREHRRGLKVLFITGYAENATLANGFLDPGMEMLTKPFAIEALATKINGLLRG